MITCDNGCGTRAPGAVVGFRALAGRQAGAAGVCLSVLPCKCTNNARDCCDEAAVLQFSLRSSLLPIYCFWESVASPPCTDKKKIWRSFFFLAFVSVVVCIKQGRREHRMHVFFPLPPAPLSLHASSLLLFVSLCSLCFTTGGGRLWSLDAGCWCLEFLRVAAFLLGDRYIRLS